MGALAGAAELWPGEALQLKQCPGGKWPGQHLDAARGPLDWRKYTSLEVALSNRTDRNLRAIVSVKSAARQGQTPDGAIDLPPHGVGTVSCDLSPEPWRLDRSLTLVGMRGYPKAEGVSQMFDLQRVSSVHVFRREGESPEDFEILSVTALEEKRESVVFTADTFLPFVDRFGQFKHLDWPGKVRDETDLAAAREKEAVWLAEEAKGPDPDRDEYGGWTKGPQLKATGFFRTEKVNGKWWFVDPKGHLFWSLGIDCLNIDEGITGIGFRESYFEGLPAKDDPVFGRFYGRKTWKAAHGFYAETNHLPYATYNFAAANMLRKYGPDWRKTSVELAHKRLRAWGVNTVANWSQPEVYLARRTPYTVCLSTGGTPRRAGSKGWWGPLPDPDHPEFARVLRERARRMAATMKDDPWCLGVFVDNELSWHDLSDLAEVAERYFSTVRQIVKEELPNHLYLGSRIAWGTPEVYRACARHADVVSVNVYSPTFNRDLPECCEDKPMLNGEFHFGALDRGLFHTGLVPTKDQNARAEAFKTYVRSCCDNPRVIGTHWFQWKDQPLTGRSDGENYQIGFLTVTDAPYPEMVAAVREVSASLYSRRAGVAAETILVEAEDFSDRGVWRVDTQFTHTMGSAYLLAAGVLKPIGAAKTRVTIPSAGAWHAWVRTKDWLPTHSPGKFVLSVGGVRGPVLGASGKEGWRWERAGKFNLQRGAVELALEDLSGAFARCDAVLLTGDSNFVPPEDAKALETFRDRLAGRSSVPREAGHWDVVVVGAGPAGLGAAIAAARTGARVALVHDRPELGGNSSREIGVAVGGAAEAWPNRRPNMRETGLVEEADLRRGRAGDGTFGAAFAQMVAAETNLTVFANARVMSVEKEGARIVAVVSRQTRTGERSRFCADTFIDCTGDGWIGYFAGAEYRRGREARDEFGEAEAPETRDDLMMSGSLMHAQGGYRYKFNAVPTPYATPAWADVLPAGFTRRVNDLNFRWWLEHHGRFDELADPERARDELVRINFAYWGWLKNDSPLTNQASKAELTSLPHMNGRREGMRLVGDYILTGNDIKAGRIFDDAVAYGGWPMDTHDPLGVENPKGDGYWKAHPGVPTYTIPYRSLYSRNIENLYMAGRCLSATHMALGSVRVEATLFGLGQAVGTASALAHREGLSPRDYGKARLRDLQQRLLRDDQYIPGSVNEDPADVARRATVTATSVQKGTTPDAVIDGISRQVGDVAHAWISDPAAALPQVLRLDFPEPTAVAQVRLAFDSDLTPKRAPRYSPRLVRGYVVEGLVDGAWVTLAEERDNFLRHRVHDFAVRKLDAVRLTVTATWGDPSARVFEMRVY